MRSRLQNSPLWPLITLSLAALRPILQENLPCSDDVAFHLLRLTQLHHLIDNGIFYSRWAPDMAFGYGFPLFNFYAPLSYYAADLIARLVGDLHLGLRLTFAAGLFLAGGMAYRLARDHFSRPAALVAAVAYMYAPYHAYDILFRGNLAESFAWWLLPSALWCMGRLARTAAPRWLAATVAAYAGVLLTHNAFALIFSPLLGLYGLWHVYRHHGRWSDRLRPAVWVSVACGLGLTVTAFFWLPALVERAYVHSDRLLVPPVFVYWGNFITLGELLAPPRPVYSDLLNPSIPRALGLVPAVAALPGVGWLFTRRTDPRRAEVGFMLAAAAVYSLLMLEMSRPVWDVLPLLEYIQFPWRLLGCAALTLAVLCAASVDFVLDRLPDRWPTAVRVVWPILLVVAIALADLYWLDARYCRGLRQPTVADIVTFEQNTATIGTTAKGEYVPQTADYVPAEPYARPFDLPDTITAHATGRTPLAFTADLTNPTTEPITITANAFVYPGWRATVDGEPAAITPHDGDGLIALAVPAGRHEIEIWFGSTPLRRGSTAASAVGVLLLLGCGWMMQRRAGNRLPISPKENETPAGPIWPLTVTGLLLFGVVVGLPQMETVLQRGRPAAWAEREPTAVYAGGLRLLDYRLGTRQMPADGRLSVTVWLDAVRQPDAAYQTTLRLTDAAGRIWSPKDTVRPRIFRSYYNPQTWPLDRFAEDMHLLSPLSGTPPGTYTVELVVFDRETERIDPTTAGAQTVALGTVELTRPDRPVAVDAQYEADLDFGPIDLVGYNLDRAEANVGDPFRFTGYWHTQTPPTQPLAARLWLVPDGGPASANTAVLTQTLPPAVQTWPTTQWRADEVWRGQHTFRIPATVPGGMYRWHVCVIDAAGNGCVPQPLRPLAVSAPDRTFTAPDVDRVIERPLGPFAELYGIESSWGTAPDGDLDLTLIWRATAETADSYRVFVHVRGADGRVVAQSDGEPAQWTRPTTSWAAGEYITDQHTISMPTSGWPDEPLTVVVGLYNPADGTRLTTPDGADVVPVWPSD